MKDTYPLLPGLPHHHLVSPGAQPDYADAVLPDFITGTTIADGLADAHVRRGNGAAPAAIHGETGKVYSFEDLSRDSGRLAAGLLDWGIRPGDRIAYKSTNDPDVLIVMMGIWKAGAVVVPIPSYAKPGEIGHFIEDTEPRLIFGHTNAGPLDALADNLSGSCISEVLGFGPGHEQSSLRPWTALMQDGPAPLPAVDPDQPALIWHTGGTTGRPKGCYHTHRRFLAGGYSFGAGNQVAAGQRWAATAPVGHALGILYNTIFTLPHGATAVMIENFSDPGTVLKAVTDHKITTLTGLMASWAKMADFIRHAGPEAEIDTSSLRRCFAMWQAASASGVFDFWLGRGVELLNNFGSTAFANWVLCPRPGDKPPRAALGRAMPGYRAAAVTVDNGKVQILPTGEIGQLAVKGPTGLTYWNLPALQAKDVVEGWTLCDDLVRFDESGQAHYLGRTDYMISTGGFKVAPVEVEEILSQHPAVREICVVPAPCSSMLEKVAAFVALNPGIAGNDGLKQELIDLAKAHLAFYKVPRDIHFIAALPRDSVGKVQTKIVKAWTDNGAVS